MKRAFVLGTLGLLACSSMAIAGQVRVYKNDKNPFKAGHGGEFRLAAVGGISAGQTSMASDVLTGAGLNPLYNAVYGSDFSRGEEDFETFCLERDESMVDGILRFSLDTAAVRGGTGGGSPDPLGAESAYLYTKFRTGSLAGYAYGGINTSGYDTLATATRQTIEEARQSTAKALQHAFWWFEQELGNSQTSDLTDYFLDNANDLTPAEQVLALSFANMAINAVQNGYSNPNIMVLNLFEDVNNNGIFDDDDILRQSVLTLIPLPSGSLMAVAGLSALAVRRRRF